MARAWMGALTASTIASAASATNATFLGRVSLSTVMLAFSLPRLGTATAPREIHPPDQRRRPPPAVHWVVERVDEEPSPGLDTFSPPRRAKTRHAAAGRVGHVQRRSMRKRKASAPPYCAGSTN